MVLFCCGWEIIKITALPILFLFFAIPLPTRIYVWLTLPMRRWASEVAAAFLNIIPHIDAMATGVVIEGLYKGKSFSLNVAEACAGMRLMMAFFALGVAMAYLDYKPIWQRVILVIAAIPIAIFCNVIRVAITCWMYYIDEPELGQDFMHHFTGVLMLIPAFAMLWVLAWIIQHIFVEESES